MGNLNVAFVGAPGLASEIGKRETATDIALYAVREGTDSVTLIEPSKYPDRLSSLFYSVQMAEFVVLVVDRIDSFLGETVVMLDAQKKDRGWIVLRNYIQPEQISPLLMDTCLRNYEFKEGDATSMRLALIAMAKAMGRIAGDCPCGSCPVDSHFNVKGVGTVVLGTVADGCLRVHDRMTVWPIRKEAVLRSIQKYDADVSDGSKGDRVGLALRGIDSGELDRGFVCSTDPSIRMSGTFAGEVDYSPFQRNALREGMAVHVGHWMQIVPAHVAKAGGRDDDAILEFDGQIVHRPGDGAVVMYLEGGKLRVFGTVVLN